MVRLRTKGFPMPSGGKAIRVSSGTTTLDLTQNGSSVYKEFKQCEDDLGRDKVNPLLINSFQKVVAPLNGKRQPIPSIQTYREYIDWVPGYFMGNSYGHLSVSGLPSEGAAATTLLARTNPSNASVSLPVFFAELRDLPHTLRQIGDIANLVARRRRRPPSPSEAGGWYLGYQFGIAPLVSDLGKMLTFTEQVDKKVDELKRLYSKGGLRRRRKLGSAHASDSSDVTVESNLSDTIRCKMSVSTRVEMWGTVRWEPTSLPRFNTDRSMRDYARRLVYGMTGVSASDLWNVVPWTWLADYFGNVGEFLQAHDGRVPARAAKVSIMTRTHTTRTFTRNDSYKEFSGGFGTITRTTKKRSASGATLATRLSLITGRQMSILGALAISRHRRFN